METYRSAKKKIAKLLKNAKTGKVSTTTDGWTAGNHLAIIAITATWFTESFELKEIVLSFREVGVSHTGIPGRHYRIRDSKQDES